MPQRAWTYIKNFRFQSVFFKYVRLILCIIIVPTLLINIGVLFIYRQVNEKDVASENLQTLSRSLNAANMVFQEVDNLRRTVTNDSTAQAVLSPVGNASQNEERDFAYSLSEMVSTHPYIHSVYAYSYKDDYCYASKNSSFFSMFYDMGFLSDKTDTQLSEITIWNRTVPAFGGAGAVPVLTIRSPIYIHDQLSGLFAINLSLEALTTLIARTVQRKPCCWSMKMIRFSSRPTQAIWISHLQIRVCPRQTQQKLRMHLLFSSAKTAIIFPVSMTNPTTGTAILLCLFLPTTPPPCLASLSLHF